MADPDNFQFHPSEEENGEDDTTTTFVNRASGDSAGCDTGVNGTIHRHNFYLPAQFVTNSDDIGLQPLLSSSTDAPDSDTDTASLNIADGVNASVPDQGHASEPALMGAVALLTASQTCDQENTESSNCVSAIHYGNHGEPVNGTLHDIGLLNLPLSLPSSDMERKEARCDRKCGQSCCHNENESCDHPQSNWRGGRPKKFRRPNGELACLQDQDPYCDELESDEQFDLEYRLPRPSVVGGVRRGENACGSNSYAPVAGNSGNVHNRSSRNSEREDDLVDEGAVCDFDRNVFPEEQLLFPGDTSSLSLNDSSSARRHVPNGHADSYLAEFQCCCVGRHHGNSCRQMSRRNVSNGDEYGSDDGDDASGPEDQGNEDQDADDIDTGDFIDTDLPALSGQRMSASSDSASLSSDNADFVEHDFMPNSNPLPGSSVTENDLSCGLNKQLNHRDIDCGFRRVSSRQPGRSDDNALHSSDLQNPEVVCWNNSESENECEGVPVAIGSISHSMPVLDGAGGAEAAPNHPPVGEQQPYGAGGDLAMCFHLDRACCLNSHWPTASCSSRDSSQAHSASRSCFFHYGAMEGGAGACAPLDLSLPVNNLSQQHPALPAVRSGETLSNGLDDVAPFNFNNDINHQQKVFDKFPMVEESRDGACGSEVGQGKSGGDSVFYPCPVASSPGVAFDRPDVQDQEALTLAPNLQSVSSAVIVCSHNSSQPWRSSSGCGVSEAQCMDMCMEPCPSSDCPGTCNVLQHLNKEDGKQTRKKRFACFRTENGLHALPAIDRVMIWSEYEAYLLQVKQIGMSACGQTAVLNLLKAFGLVAEKEDVCRKIQVNMRKEKASVAEYLASRAVAGTTAEDLLCGVQRLTRGEISGRFFPTWPPRQVQLLAWLSYWMKQGAVPVATLNLQQGMKQQQIPDAWHHQMVYGVGPRGVYLTNPLEIVSDETMLTQLTSDSVLLVRRQDIVSRFQPSASLVPLLHQADPRWCTMNVLGQVVNVLREHNMPNVPGYRAQITSHVRIPAVYRAGITLFVKLGSPEWRVLCKAPDLPLLTDSC